MLTLIPARRLIMLLLIMFSTFATTACTGVDSSFDRAYYGAGDIITIPGGYNRTIFSSSNF